LVQEPGLGPRLVAALFVFHDLDKFFVIAGPAVRLYSGGNSQAGQDDGLEQNPGPDDDKQPKSAHFILLFGRRPK